MKAPTIRSLATKLLLALAGPAVFLCSIEGVLALFGVGRPTDFFIPDTEPGMYRTNPRFTDLFFPASFGLKPLNFRIPKEKPAGAIRIFLLGESAAMGVPEPGFGIAPQLQAQLRATHPGQPVEVYNLGVTAINSHVIRRIVRQAVEFHPDLLVVYMGNNEVVGPFGPGSAITEGVPPLWLIRVSLWARATRVGQWWQGLLARFAAPGHGYREWRGMEMFSANRVGVHDPRLASVYRNFRANLDDILDTGRKAGVPILLATVAVDLRDCAPFASLHRAGISPEELARFRETVEQGRAAAELGQRDEARVSFERALAIDPENANAHYLLARVLDASGDEASARDHYLHARRLDALRFRADESINAIIRAEAGAHPREVTLVDAAGAFGSAPESTAPPPGHDLFFEHVHLTWKGNYALARLFAAPAAAILFGNDDAQQAEWLTSEACAEAVGYTNVGRQMMLMRMDALTARPPFTNQSSFARDRTMRQREIEATNAALREPGALTAALEKIETARRRNPRNAFLVAHAAVVRAQSGDLAGALELENQVMALEPASPEDAVRRAYILHGLGRSAEAESLLLRSAEAEPYYFQTYSLLAGIWESTGQRAEAARYFEKLVARMPGSQVARLAYARILQGRGDWAGAEAQWRELLRRTPDDEAALLPLIERLYQKNQPEAALELMLAAFDYNPRSLPNNQRLVQIFAARGDSDQAIKFMRALEKSGEVNALLHADLAAELLKTGRKQEALLELRRAEKAARDEGETALTPRIEALRRQALQR